MTQKGQYILDLNKGNMLSYLNILYYLIKNDKSFYEIKKMAENIINVANERIKLNE